MPETSGRQAAVQLQGVDARNPEDRVDAVEREQLGQVDTDGVRPGALAHGRQSKACRKRRDSPGASQRHTHIS